ncbi:N-acetyltransferase [uncultured Pseudokineococcus sp.]|uniref:GNAT family N-acetyltransferase n=1 Tax=uncultured Pseudokineococcus sp. TaxID=1642928 RepID=UPI0026214320|nr:GNAT family N-acetyltransferase [uncultured Pseudokineococcus sp.]
MRPAEPGDLAVTARWQCQHLPHGFFPGLGERFVARWHDTHRDAPHGTALVAELVDAEGPVSVGFLVGASDQAAHVEDVLARHRWALLRAGAVALLARPATAVRFARTRARPYARRLLASSRGGDVPTAPAPDVGPVTPVAVVSAVVVDPAARGAGVGEALLAAFCERARAAGTPVAELVTRADGGAAAFYERLGWQRVADRTSRDGARVLTYRLDLGSTAAEPRGRTTSGPRLEVRREGGDLAGVVRATAADARVGATPSREAERSARTSGA